MSHYAARAQSDCRAELQHCHYDEVENFQSDETCSLCDDLPPHRGSVWDDDQVSLCDELPHRYLQPCRRSIPDDDDQISLCDELPHRNVVRVLQQGELPLPSDDELSICDDLPPRGTPLQELLDVRSISDEVCSRVFPDASGKAQPARADDEFSICDDIPHGTAQWSSKKDYVDEFLPSRDDPSQSLDLPSDDQRSLCDELPHGRTHYDMSRSLCDELPRRRTLCEEARPASCDESPRRRAISDESRSVCDDLPRRRVRCDDSRSLCDDLPRFRKFSDDSCSPCDDLPCDRLSREESRSLCDDLPHYRPRCEQTEHFSKSRDNRPSSLYDELVRGRVLYAWLQDEASACTQAADDEVFSLCDELPHGRLEHFATDVDSDWPVDDRLSLCDEFPPHHLVLRESADTDEQPGNDQISLCDELPRDRVLCELPGKICQDDQLSLCDDMPHGQLLSCDDMPIGHIAHARPGARSNISDDELSLCDELPCRRVLQGSHHTEDENLRAGLVPRLQSGVQANDAHLNGQAVLSHDLRSGRRNQQAFQSDEQQVNEQLQLCEDLPLNLPARDRVRSVDEYSLCDDLPSGREVQDASESDCMSDDDFSICDDLRGRLIAESGDTNDWHSDDSSFCDDFLADRRARLESGTWHYADDNTLMFVSRASTDSGAPGVAVRQQQHRSRIFPLLGRYYGNSVERLRRGIAAVKARTASPPADVVENERQVLDLPATVPSRVVEQTLTISLGEFRREFVIPRQVFSRTTTMTLQRRTAKHCDRPFEEEDQCAVCLDNFEAGQKLRVFPCGHRFHTICIDAWLNKNHRCPVCRHDPLHPSSPR